MNVLEVTSAVEFLAVTEDLRSADPVLTNVIGSVATAVAAGAQYDDELWLVVIDDGRVVGCAVRTAPWPALLSPMSADAAHLVGEHLAARIPDLGMLTGPRDVTQAAAAGFGAEGVVHMRDVVRVLGSLVPAPDCPGSSRACSASDLPLLLEWFTAFNDEAGIAGPVNPEMVTAAVTDGRLWVWLATTGEPVAMAGHARVVATPSATVGRIGPVYTVPTHRRRGYGAALTHVVASILRAQCDEVMLFADAANSDSNSVYEKLGFAQVAQIVELQLVSSR